jgi:fructose-1,6-bisphosphatase/inositol monophosphatase family enzyme
MYKIFCMNLESIVSVFKNLPASKILTLAKSIQAQIPNDASLVKNKASWDFVTKADTEVQNLVLDYFCDSDLAGTFVINAEENLLPRHILTPKNPTWQLVLDPIDGTNPFARGESTWGTMVGACDMDGKLIVSWNQLSDGRIFTSYEEVSEISLREPHGSDGLLSIDFCDYGTDQDEFFLAEVNRQLPEQKKTATNNYNSAIWAGASLYYGENQALVWIATDGEKKFYPAYDLIYLGALAAQGWCVKIGKIGAENALIIVACTEDLAVKLWNAGLATMEKNLAEQVVEEKVIKIL